MAEPQPSKLMTRVRFPSPAPANVEMPFIGSGLCTDSVQARVDCPCGSVVEHYLGKGEVALSIRAMGTITFY